MTRQPPLSSTHTLALFEDFDEAPIGVIEPGSSLTLPSGLTISAHGLKASIEKVSPNYPFPPFGLQFLRVRSGVKITINSPKIRRVDFMFNGSSEENSFVLFRTSSGELLERIVLINPPSPAKMTFTSPEGKYIEHFEFEIETDNINGIAIDNIQCW